MIMIMNIFYFITNNTKNVNYNYEVILYYV